MRKLLFIFIFLTAISLPFKAYACSPSFPSLWPPSITSTESTEHSVGITWSQTLPFVGDITAYRIYLNGQHVHTISPSIATLLFNPAGHGSYSVNNLQPDTNYNMSVGVVFAIPVGCGITWHVQMTSSASITTKPKGWNHGVSASSPSLQDSSKPHAPAFSTNSAGIHSVYFNYNISNSYANVNFTQKKYPITQLFITIGSVCNPQSFSGYQDSPYYTESYGRGYDIGVQTGICNEVEPYKTQYVRTGRHYESKQICRYVLNHPYAVINKEINITSGNMSGSVTITGLIGDTKYVIYGYTENSNGDVSNESAPVFFTTGQGKTITPASCGRDGM